MDALKRDVVEAVRKSIRFGLPHAYSGTANLEQLLAIEEEPLLVAHLRIKTPSGPRYFEVRVKETY